MRYLVTGGAGFIGSNIVTHLLGEGHDVRVLDNFSTGRRQNLRPLIGNRKLEILEGDLRSFHIVRRAVEGVDYVLHQGAMPSVPRSIHDPITSNDVNILGTLNVLEAAKELSVARVVYASSSSVYGDSDVLPKVETLPVQPRSPYAISKYAAERYCQTYSWIYGLETVCLRYFNVFGPNQDPTSQYSAVVPLFIRAISEGRAPVLFGDGSQSRDFTYVTNVVQANVLACTAKGAAGEVANIGCGERFTLMQLVDTINAILGTSVKPQFEPARVGDVKHSLAGIDKARAILGYEPTVRFAEGLSLLVDHHARVLAKS